MTHDEMNIMTAVIMGWRSIPNSGGLWWDGQKHWSLGINKTTGEVLDMAGRHDHAHMLIDFAIAKWGRDFTDMYVCNLASTLGTGTHIVLADAEQKARAALATITQMQERCNV